MPSHPVPTSPDAIIVRHGQMTLRFPAGTTQAAIDKRLKAIDAATKQAQKLVANPRSTWPTLPKPTRCKVPSTDMLEAAGQRANAEGKHYPGKGYTHRYMAHDAPLVVMPLDMLKAGLLAAAHRTLKKWPDENPPEYAKWVAMRETKLASMDTEHLVKVVASILRPGGRVASGKYAASFVWGLEELERRGVDILASMTEQAVAA